MSSLKSDRERMKGSCEDKEGRVIALEKELETAKQVRHRCCTDILLLL